MCFLLVEEEIVDEAKQEDIADEPKHEEIVDEPKQDPLVSTHKTSDSESDLSDVEEQGYCDDSTEYNIDIKMRLEPVREKTIKDLYTNTEKVRVLYNHL